MEMLINYELYDKHGEPLMSMLGKRYISNKNVLFYDIVHKPNKEYIVVEFLAKVINHTYNIYADSLEIECEILNDLTEEDEINLKKYNKYRYRHK